MCVCVHKLELCKATETELCFPAVPDYTVAFSLSLSLEKREQLSTTETRDRK